MISCPSDEGLGEPDRLPVLIDPNDEREGLPSASSFQRYATCPGSIALEFQLRAIGQLPIDHGSSDSDRGTRIHDILSRLALGEGDPMRGATEDEIEVAMTLWERAQEQIVRIFGTGLENLEVIVEERYWFMNSLGKKLASGRFDLIVHDFKRGLILDYKALFGDHPAAAVNRQLKFGAVVLREETGIAEIRGALVQNMKAVSFADYNALDLEDAMEEMDMILLRKERDPFALGFVRSEQCKFCPARLACPALQWDTAQLQASPLAIIAGSTDEQLGRFGVALQSVKHLETAFVAEATARITAGRTVPGWVMEPNKPKRTVTKARELANALVAAGAPLNDVLAAMTIGVGDAERLHKKATNRKGKDARTDFDAMTSGMIEKPEPTLTLKLA